MNHRYDFVYLFDVKDANPNGDPDAGNLPRVDVETGQGLITDVCLKRKIRNYVQLTHEDVADKKIFVKEKAILNTMIDEAHEQENVKSQSKAGDKTDAARRWMCENYYDIRTFGAVMSTGKNAGQVRGPVQLSFSRSIDQVVTSEHAVTRMAVTTEKEAEKQHGENRTMGRKFTIPYALYCCHGTVNPFLAKQTGFSEEGDGNDLDILFQSLVHAFDFDASAARPAGSMAAQKLIVFKHDTALGNAPAHKLFELVNVKRNNEEAPPRSFSDYTVTIGSTPGGVELIEKI